MVFLEVLKFPRKFWFRLYCFPYSIRAKRQRNPRKKFRRNPHQTSHCHRGRRHGKISPNASETSDLHSGTTLAAIRATLRLESLSCATSVWHVGPHTSANLSHHPSHSFLLAVGSNDHALPIIRKLTRLPCL